MFRRTATVAVAAVAAVAAAAAAVSGQVAEFPDTPFDNARPFTTYVTSNDDGTPAVVGFTLPDFDDGGLTIGEGPLPPTTGRFSFDVDHPEQAQIPFDHMQADYNPFGHPGGFNETEANRLIGLLQAGEIAEFEATFVGQSPYFAVPHWDVHFQLPAADSVETWVCANDGPTCQPGVPGNEPFFVFPEPDYMPDTYYPDVLAAVPKMGTHWEDKNLEFTKENGRFLEEPVVIFGSFDGKPIFHELMISNAALRLAKDSGSEHAGALVQPKYFPTAGYWPTSYGIFYADGSYHFEMRDFVYRCGGVCQLSSCDCNSAAASSGSSHRSVSIGFHGTGGCR